MILKEEARGEWNDTKFKKKKKTKIQLKELEEEKKRWCPKGNIENWIINCYY